MLTKGTIDDYTADGMGKTCLTFHNGLKNFSKRLKLGKEEEIMNHVYECADMDGSQEASENMVLSQSLSHEQLQNNREVLARRLKLRRPREELINQGIMPAVSAAPTILQQKTRLERAKTGDILQRKIRHRPNRSQLIQRHILEDSTADGSLQARQISLKRKKLQDDLNERLLMRPGPLELVNKNILQPDSMVSHAIKEGAVEYSDTKDSTLIKNALSPPESFTQDDISPSPSPDTASSIGSPPDLSQMNIFSPGSFQPPENTNLNFQMANLQAMSVVKPKEPKSRKKSNKSKFKKYKYHEYRPPNVETAVPKPETIPADSPYSLLLQQQQLYLQLQVLCQNYPQTFLPLMPVQKSNQADKNVDKPMKLEDMRVIDLRNELKSRGLPVSGSKNHLMERLKLANATQATTGANQSALGTSTYAATPTNAPTSVTSMIQQPTPLQAAQHTSLSRSISAPNSVTMVNPAKVMSDAEKILQSEQNISVEEIQQKIQQLQYLNLQIQLKQLDIKKNQQLSGKQQLQPKPADRGQHVQQFAQNQQQVPKMQQPLHNPQQRFQQQQQLRQQLQQLQPPQQLKIEQHIQQPKHSGLSPTLRQTSVEQKLLPAASQETKKELIPTSLPPPQQCQVSISATPLLHCSALSCPHTPNHAENTQQNLLNSQTALMNSVQQHNVIHFKQPVKPVIILQPPKLQQRAELLFSPPGSDLDNDVMNEAFFQQLSKKDDMTMEQDWHNLIDDDVLSRHSSASPSSYQSERSPPPYFEAVAGRLSPIRTSSFSSTSSGSGLLHRLSPDSTSSMGHRRSLSVPTVHNQANIQPQELQKGSKSSSMCFDFVDSPGDQQSVIAQELQKAMVMGSHNDLDANSAELLELLGDALRSTSPNSLMSSSSPNLTSYSPYSNSTRPFSAGSSPKGPRSPTTSLPSYEEAIQNTLSVQSSPGKFGSNELLNNYDHQGSPVSLRQNSPGSRKSSVPSLDGGVLLGSPGSPMRMDSDEMDLLHRGMLEANDYQRDAFNLGDMRSNDARGGSLFHVDPSAIFGNPQNMTQDSRMIKQEPLFLDIDPNTDFPDAMEFGLPSDTNMAMSGVAYGHS